MIDNSNQSNCDCGKDFSDLIRTADGDLYYCENCEIYLKTSSYPKLLDIESKTKQEINQKLKEEQKLREEKEKEDLELKKKIRQEEYIKNKANKLKAEENNINEAISKIDFLYYIAPFDNLISILQCGLLSKNELIRRSIKFSDCSNIEVQLRRHLKRIALTNGSKKYIHDLVPLYFSKSTPTSYLMINNCKNKDFIYICISKKILFDVYIEYCFTDGNVACESSQSFTKYQDLKYLDWETIKSIEYDYFDKEQKRKRCSEFLVFPYIDRKHFAKFIVNKYELRNKIMSFQSKFNLQIPVEISY